jgi:probable HAF family extracellular repeat protein
MKDLGVLPGDFNSGAIAINDRGEVVGVSGDTQGNTRAFIWRNGLMTDLNRLAPADSPLYLLFAAGINDRGEMVGYGATKGGDIHAFLATPDNAVAASKALGVERPEGLSEALRKEFPHSYGKRIPSGQR